MISTIAPLAVNAASIAAHPDGPWAGGPWGAGFGWVFLLIPLFWIGFFAILFAIVRRSRRAGWGGGYWPGYGPGYGPGFGPGFGQGGGPRWSQPSRAAEATLAERFAQGDIDEKEYRARLEVLRANGDYGDPTRK